MSEFIQLHMLVSYPPSNLNRDDLGRPKTAVMGGKQRLRVSSQSLKRAWRLSDNFFGMIAIRTKILGSKIEKSLAEGVNLTDLLNNDSGSLEKCNETISPDDALIWSVGLMNCFGELENETDESGKAQKVKTNKLKQVIHISNNELKKLNNLLIAITEYENRKENKKIEFDFGLFKELSKKIYSGVTLSDPEKKKTKKLNEQLHEIILKKFDSDVDIAMFGRMLTSAPGYNTEAAVQVSHAITVHDVAIEDDWFTAVDDLNTGEENAGSAHIGELEFASGLFYTYVCINRDLLVENLFGDSDLADKAIQSLIEAAAKFSPSGKQNSFASRAYASYILAEKGTQQPRSLAVSFLKPVRDTDMLGGAIKEFETLRGNMEKVYGKCADDCISMNVQDGTGSLDEILTFVSR